MKGKFQLRKIVVTNEDGRRYEVTLKASFSYIKNEQQFRNRVRIGISKIKLMGGDYAVYADALTSRSALEVAISDLNMVAKVRELK